MVGCKGRTAFSAPCDSKLARRVAVCATGVKLKRAAIDAVAQPRVAGTVRKDMNQMSFAGRAAHLDAPHAEGSVFVLRHGISVGTLGEPPPPRSGKELRVGAEQGRAAANAAIHAGALFLMIGMAEGALGAVFARHVELLRRKALTPIILGLRICGPGSFVRISHRVPFRSIVSVLTVEYSVASPCP